jgi:outer membrane protein insertion porin family
VDLRAPDDPSLSRAGVASLLITRRRPEDLRGREGEALGERVASYLAGNLGTLAARGLGDALPVSRIGLEPTLVGGETDPGVRFSVGQALAENLFLTYSIGLNDTEQQIWILDYELPKRLGLRAIRQENNEYTGSLSQELQLDLTGRRSTRPAKEALGRSIARVVLDGELVMAEEKLRREVGLSAGDRYDYWKAATGAEKVRDLLRRSDYLGAVVDFDTRSAEGESPPGSVEVVYRVTAGPLTRFSWEGDDPGRAIKDAARRCWEGRLPVRLMAAELEDEVTESLRRERFYRAKVSVSLADALEERQVLVHVDKGSRGKGVSLEFQGNRALTTERLTRSLPPISSREFFHLVFDGDDRLVRSLQLAYAEQGFLDARVTEVRTEYEDTGKLLVRIVIEEGSQARLSELVFEGAGSIPEARLRRELRLEAGGVFHLAELVRARAALASLYRREGFPEARVGSRLTRGASGVEVAILVSEGPAVRVGTITVVGNDKTREHVVRRELAFRPGEPMRLSALTESQRRLSNLNLFRAVDVRPATGTAAGGEVRDVVVEVTERSDLDVSYGFRYNTENRFEALGDVQLPNLLGTSRHLGLRGLLNPDQSVLRLVFSTPYWFGRRLGTDAFVSRETEEDAFTDTRTWSFTLQQRRPLREKLSVQWSYSFRRINVKGKVVTGPFAFDFSTDRAILTASLIEDQRDSVTRTTRGRFWNTTFQVAPRLLASDLNFVKLFGQLFYFKPLSRGMVWASSYRAGIADGFGQTLIQQDRFTAGGANSVRGFEPDLLGPADPITGTVIGGEGVLVLNQELRLPLFWRLGGVGFLDAGNVFLEAGDFNPFDLRVSAGVGLRVDLPVGLFRLDWARILNPETGERRSRFYFSFGHAF